jgi:hypothetical protein
VSQDRGELLKAACDAVVADPALQPEYSAKTGLLIATHCDDGAAHVARAMGCEEFADPDLTADLMHALMTANASGRWRRVSGQEAVFHALDGGLAFAAATGAMLGEKHGHICAIRPEARQFSSSLNRDVPMVANVGKGDPSAPLVDGPAKGLRTKRNWNCRVSGAFPVAKGEPEYFIWT